MTSLNTFISSLICHHNYYYNLHITQFNVLHSQSFYKRDIIYYYDRECNNPFFFKFQNGTIIVHQLEVIMVESYLGMMESLYD